MTRKTPLILALVLMAISPAAAHAYLPQGFVGVSPQSPASSSDFELMRESGITSVRLPLNWIAIEPDGPGATESDWDGFDHEVGLAAESGIRIMPFVSASPTWVAAQPIALPVNSSWQRRAWASFLRRAVGRYGPHGSFWEENPALPFLPIRRWEIWNEENIVTFAERPDPAGFATLIRISGRILHRADPGAQVILGGLFGRPLQIPPNVSSGDYLSRVYRARPVKRYFDGVALHPYVARARAMGAQIVNLRRIMRVHHDAATPIYVTELGWGSDSGPTRWERGLYGQAHQLSSAFAMLSAQRLNWRIGGAWWFTWTDEGGSCQFCRSAGLLTEARKAKPAWYRFNAWTGGDPDTVPRALFGPAGDELEVAEEPEVVGEEVAAAPMVRRR
jgi:polysaccharide biosynthesis protein PslG